VPDERIELPTNGIQRRLRAKNKGHGCNEQMFGGQKQVRGKGFGD